MSPTVVKTQFFDAFDLAGHATSVRVSDAKFIDPSRSLWCFFNGDKLDQRTLTCRLNMLRYLRAHIRRR